MNAVAQQNDRSAAETVRPGARMGVAVLVLLPVFVAMIGYGLIRGDVFETYQNGSNL